MREKKGAKALSRAQKKHSRAFIFFFASEYAHARL